MNNFKSTFIMKSIYFFIFLFSLNAQEYKLKSSQITITSETLQSSELKLKGTVSNHFNGTGSGDTLLLKGGVINVALGLYSAPPTLTTFFPENITKSGEPVVARAIATDMNGISSTDLYLQPGGKRKSIKLNMSAVNDSLFEVVIPDTLLTTRNFRAYFESVDSMDYIKQSYYETPSLIIPPQGLTMDSPSSHYPDGLIPDKWRLFSWPGKLNSSAVSATSLKDDGYVFYYWDPETNKKRKPDTLKTGVAYWIQHEFKRPLIFKNADTTATAIPLEDYSIILQPGWNMIGSPFAFRAKYEYNEDKVSGIYQFGDDDTDGWSGPLDIFEPWGGYAIYNSSSTIDSITIKPFADTLKSERSFSSDWEIALKVKGQSYFDHTGRIGRKEQALDQKDGSDTPALPTATHYIGLQIDTDGNGEFGYSADLRSQDHFNGTWNIQLSGRGESGPVHFSGAFLKDIPSDLVVAALDIPKRKVHDQFLLTGITIEERLTSAYDIKLIIGDAVYVQSTVQEILADIPEKFLLSQNYPNPFNPTTKIDFALARTGDVNIVIYNLMGQQVKTLVSESLHYGYHVITWNGLDDFGRTVPSGVYFSELRAKGFRDSKKMLLLK